VPDLSAAVLKLAKSVKDFALLMSVPIAFVVVASVNAWKAGGDERRRQIGKVLLLLIAAVMAVSPLSLFEQYLGPLAFLLFLFSAPWDVEKDAGRSWYLIFAGVLLFLQSAMMLGWIVPNIVQNGGLAVARVIELQNEAHRIVGPDYRCERKFYSAAPLFLLADDVKYPPELVAGPFVMFLRGEPLARQGREFDFDAHLKKWNPDVVLWGYYLQNPEPNEVAVDRAIGDYAAGHNFVTATLGQIDGRTLQLGYRPGCKGSPHP
jgi:hypothetical protein